MNALKTNNLKKSYGSNIALNGITLTIERNEKIALLGCNGAGKSTLLSIVMGLKTQSSGACEVLGAKPNDFKNKSKINFLPQSLNFPEELKVKEVFKIVKSGENSSETKNKSFQSIAEDLGISELLDKKTSKLSGGEKRKVGLALSLTREPEITILDEPTANIDLLGKEKIYKALEKQIRDKQGTLIFSSHEMKEVERLAKRVIVLNKGEVVADGSVDEIKSMFGLKKVTFKTSSSTSDELNFSAFKKYEFHRHEHIVYGKNSDQILKSIFEQNIDFRDLKVFEPDLEEIFIKIWSK